MVKFYRLLFLALFSLVGFRVSLAQSTVVTPAPAQTNICVGSGYVTLGTIYIAETGFANFSANNNQTYVLSVPANFEFNTGVSPTITTNNPATGVSIDAGQTIVTATTLTFRFDVPGGSTGIGPLDSIIITGVQVRAVNTASSGSLARSGGSAIMNGNASTDGQVHCSLTSIQDPLITGQPVAQNSCVNDDPNFTVTATGTGLTYQWRRYNVGSSSWGNPPGGGAYSGSTTATITCNDVSTTQDGFLFACLVTGTCGTVSTDTVMLTVNNPANVTGNPSNKSICANANTTFTVSASGSSLSYQWQESSGGPYGDITNGGVYSGSTTNTLALTGVPIGMNGRTYRCVVSNACSSDYSNGGTLTVSAGPTITSDPGNSSICAGSNTTFTIAATGATSYQWQVDQGVGFNNVSGAIYSGATSATLTITGVTAAMNGYLYRCIATNSCGSSNSNAATLSVTSAGSATFFGLATQYCGNDAVDTLESFPVGGTFSGTGVGATNMTTGKAPFDPKIGGPGGRTITYTFGCTVVNKNTTINDTTNIAYTSPVGSPVYAASDPPVDLVVEEVPPAGPLPGTFSGPGVYDSRFYPNLAGPGGPFPVLFTYSNANACLSRKTINISVTDNSGTPIPPLQTGPYCPGGTPIQLNKNSLATDPIFFPGLYEFAGYDGSPDLVNSGDTLYTFSPATPGTYTINYKVRTLTWTISGFTIVQGWSYQVYASQTVTVSSSTSVDFTLPASACNTEAGISMNPFPGIASGAAGTGFSIVSPVSYPAGLLSGTGNSTFNPNVVTTQTIFTVRYTYVNASGCSGVIDKQITVIPKPTPPVLFVGSDYGGLNDIFCYQQNRKPLRVVNNPGYSYSWYNDPALTLASQISEDYNLPVQSNDSDPATYNYYVTRTFGGCISDPLTTSVTINDYPVVNPGSSQVICEGGTITLNGTSTLKFNPSTNVDATWVSLTGGSFDDPNDLNAVYTPNATEITIGYVNLYLISDDNDGTGPCPADTNEVRININKAARVDAGPDSTYCSNSTITLKGSSSIETTTWTGGAGNIVSENSLFTFYELSNAEKSGTSITFTLTSDDPDGAGPCPAVSDNVVINVSEEGEVNAGTDLAMCKSVGTTVFNLNGQSKRKYTQNPLAAQWSGGTGSFSDEFSLTSTYTPSVSEIPANGTNAKTVKLYLTTFDPDGPGTTGPCSALLDSIVLTVNPLPRIDSVKVIDTMFCTSDNSFQITVAMQSKFSEFSGIFTDLPVSNQGLSGTSSFAPGIANIGPHTIRYTYTDINGCSSFRDTLIHVYGVPKPKILIANYCATRATDFNGSSSDISFDPESVINSYAWNFGDNVDSDTSSMAITSYTYSPTLEATAIKSYNVKLTLGTDKGCIGQDDSTITIGNIPATNFKWSGICPADITAFTDISGFPSNEVSQYTWNFGDGSAPLSGPGFVSGLPNNAVKNPSHKMDDGPGPYYTTYTISSIRGCDSTLTKRVDILDDYQPTPSDPYATNFANDNAFWAVDGTNTSWQWGITNKPIINSPSRKIWITDTVDTFNPNENSNLNGPCLNMTDLDKPMIALKINSATQTQFAGAVLQASTDGGSTWSLIGNIGDGVNWYDQFGVQGSPGGQLVGQLAWSGVYNEWRLAKISLNQLAHASSVRLRVAFGSGGDTLNLKDGFALDSVWVGERDKFLLIENFTNSSSLSVGTNDAAMNALVDSRNNDVVAIHYHTSFPGADPMNNRNPADPSSRVLHYGVPSVPYKVFDGNYNYVSIDDPGLTAKDIDKRSLESAKFKIQMQSDLVGDSINMKAKIFAADSTNRDIVVHFAVIEKTANPPSLGTWRYVLAKMLPDAAGTYFSQNFNKGDSVYIEHSWNFVPGTDIYNTANVGFVIFVQDALSKEVYQTAYLSGTGGSVTGLKHQTIAGKEVFMYPNPADNEVNLMFEAGNKDYNYDMYDEFGRVVLSGVVEKGSTYLTLHTSDLAAGLYVVRIGNSEEGWAFKKVVVGH